MTRVASLPLLGLGLRTEFYEGKATVADMQALGKLVGPKQVIAVIIKNRLVNLDDTSNPLELLIGTGGGCVWPLLPGETSEIIYCKNLNDVFVRVRVAVSTSDTEGEIVTFSIANGGTGYVVNDLLRVSGGGGNNDAILKVDAVTNGRVRTVTVNTAGTGYLVNDVVTISGGGGNATVRVATVNGGGGILTVDTLVGGSGYAVIVGANVTGGSGINGKLNITAIDNGIVATAEIIDGGSGYAATVGAATTGGSGDGATITILTVEGIADAVGFPIEVYALDGANER